MKSKIDKIREIGIKGTVETLYRKTAFAARDFALIKYASRNRSVIAYLGFVGYANLGDEILFDAHRKLFPGWDIRHFRAEPIVQPLLASSVRPLFKAAILGGGTLIDHTENWLRPVEHLLKQHTRMFCIGTGVEDPAFWPTGLAHSEIGRRWASALNEFMYVGVRGPHSLKLLQEMGVKNAEIVGDTALALGTPPKRQDIVTKQIGLCYGDAASNPMWGDRESYRRELVKAISHLCELGYSIALLPVWGIDGPSNRQLLREINNPNVSLIDDHMSLRAYERHIRACTVFIGQKLHASIIALMNGVPTLMLEYNPKCRDFMASIGVEDFVIRTSELTAASLIERVSELEKHGDTMVNKTVERVQYFQQLQNERARQIITKIDSQSQ